MPLLPTYSKPFPQTSENKFVLNNHKGSKTKTILGIYFKQSTDNIHKKIPS